MPTAARITAKRKSINGIKAHHCVAVKTNVVIAVAITDGNSNDYSPQLGAGASCQKGLRGVHNQ